MHSWDLIVWTTENTVDCVPSSWLVGSSPTKYLYPKNMRKSKILKLIKNCTPPSAQYSYQELEARFKKTIKNYSHAEAYLKRMELTSNVEDNDGCNNRVYTEVTDVTGSAALYEPTFLYDCANVQIDMPENKLEGIENLLKTLITETQNLKLTLSEIREGQNNLEVAIATLTPDTNRDLRFSDWNVPLPIKDAEDFEKAENLLPENGYILVNLLALVGGQSLRHNITLMIKKLLSKNIASQYSGHGRKGKKNFSQTKFIPVIMEAARLKENNATDSLILQYIGFALAGVKDWEGGYKRPLGQKAANNDGNLEENENEI